MKNIIPAGVDYHKPVISLDIMATIVGQANVDVCEIKPLDGVDLIPFITNQDTGTPHDVLFWRHVKSNSYAMRRGNEKMIKTPNESHFFNIEQDHIEANNLLPETRANYKALDASYQLWQQDLEDGAFQDLNNWSLTRSSSNSKSKSGSNKKKKNKKAKNK